MISRVIMIMYNGKSKFSPLATGFSAVTSSPPSLHDCSCPRSGDLKVSVMVKVHLCVSQPIYEA